MKMQGGDANEFNTFEKILIAVIAFLFGSVILSQTYMAGQRNPDPQKYITVDKSVDLATERQQAGYDAGFTFCQEQF